MKTARCCCLLSVLFLLLTTALVGCGGDSTADSDSATPDASVDTSDSSTATPDSDVTAPDTRADTSNPPEDTSSTPDTMSDTATPDTDIPEDDATEEDVVEPDASDDVSGPPIEDQIQSFEDELMRAMMENVCRTALQCPDSVEDQSIFFLLGRYQSVQTCVDDTTQLFSAMQSDRSLSDSSANGRLEIDIGKADQCLQKLRNLEQCEMTDFNIDLNEFCGEIITPKRDVGQTCNDSSECIGDNVYCDGALTGEECYGTCQEDRGGDGTDETPVTMVDRGDDCDLDSKICRPGTVCRGPLDGGTCKDPGQQGDDCFVLYQCAAGHYCEGANFQTGEPGSCQPQKAVGEQCPDSNLAFFDVGFSDQCQTFHCQDGTCKHPEQAPVCEVPEQ